MEKARRVAVRGIIFKEGRLFAQRLHGNETYWCTPGGGLDANEGIHDGLYREMVEETGIAPKIGRLILMQQYADGEREHLEFFFHIENSDDYHEINLADTTHGEQEIAEFGFVDPLEANVLPKILQEIDLQDITENTRPVLVKDYLAEEA